MRLRSCKLYDDDDDGGGDDDDDDDDNNNNNNNLTKMKFTPGQTLITRRAISLTLPLDGVDDSRHASAPKSL